MDSSSQESREISMTIRTKADADADRQTGAASLAAAKKGAAGVVGNTPLESDPAAEVAKATPASVRLAS